jgi:hypothetical protein
MRRGWRDSAKMPYDTSTRVLLSGEAGINASRKTSASINLPLQDGHACAGVGLREPLQYPRLAPFNPLRTPAHTHLFLTPCSFHSPHPLNPSHRQSYISHYMQSHNVNFFCSISNTYLHSLYMSCLDRRFSIYQAFFVMFLKFMKRGYRFIGKLNFLCFVLFLSLLLWHFCTFPSNPRNGLLPPVLMAVVFYNIIIT